MRKLQFCLVCAALAGLTIPSAHAQNWNLVIVDNVAGTSANQVNGTAGGTATLYGTIFNFTGTPSSDDGTRTNTPAAATTLDFGGFGFTQNPGQYDLGGLFTASDAPGSPSVAGSADNSAPGTSGYRTFGTFDLSGLAPGVYQEDFTAGAFPDDANSTVSFGDINGTLTLNVSAAPEPGSMTSFGVFGLALGTVCLRRSRVRRSAVKDAARPSAATNVPGKTGSQERAWRPR